MTSNQILSHLPFFNQHHHLSTTPLKLPASSMSSPLPQPPSAPQIWDQAMATSQNPQITQTHTNTEASNPYSPNITTPPSQQPIIMSMFGALNRFISRLDAAPLNEEQQSSTNGAYGFQVLRNANMEVPLEPWFDFVIGINGRTIVCMIQERKSWAVLGK
jgi:hypothetical protein